MENATLTDRVARYLTRVSTLGGIAVAVLVSTGAVAHAAVLSIDINDRDTPGDTQSGFTALNQDTGGIGAMTTTVGGVTIDVDPVGYVWGNFDRRRADPTDAGALTQSAIYRDFVFADGVGTADTNGLDVNLSGLAADTWYLATVWSFDDGSNTTRTSDWTTVGGNGTQLVADNYQFNGSTLPTANDDDRFSFWVRTDSSGEFKLEGRNVTTDDPAVFFNGIQLVTYSKQFFIDIDSTNLGGSSHTGVETESGWTSLDASGAGSVTVDGVTFTPFSEDGDRIRVSGGNANPNDLTGDFVFDDGPGESVGLLFGGAGDLEAGTWRVELWIWDETNSVDPVIVGYRRNGAETIVASGVLADADNPAISFVFESDGIGAYDVFVRDAPGGSTHRTRLNAVRLVLLPAPSALPAGLAMIGLLAARRRRR